MKVSELIELLEEEDQEMEVAIAYSGGAERVKAIEAIPCVVRHGVFLRAKGPEEEVHSSDNYFVVLSSKYI